MTILYLAGPINGCTDEECVDWRKHIKDLWGYPVKDPMVRDYRGQEGDFYREIVDLDKRDIRQSDIVIVNYIKPSVGTSMEVFYAWTLGKPIIVVAKRGTRISPWLQYHSTCIVETFALAREKVIFYDS